MNKPDSLTKRYQDAVAMELAKLRQRILTLEKQVAELGQKEKP